MSREIHMQLFFKHVLPMLEGGDGGRLVSMGCGEFLEYDYLRHRFEQIIGVDIEPKYESGDFIFICHDLRRSTPSLFIKNNTTDCILATEILEHLGQVTPFIDTCHRILKVNGVLLVSCPLIGLRERLRIFFGGGLGMWSDEHPRLFFRSELIDKFESNGFRLEEERHLGKMWLLNRNFSGFGYFKFRKV